MSSTTTWSDMPVEMLFEVIKHLDFESRMKMRRTARLEKAVVEATKINVHHVKVEGSFRNVPRILVGGPNGIPEEEFGFEGPEEKLIALTTSLMKFGKIKTFQLSAVRSNSPRRHFMEGSMDFLEKVTAGGGRFKFPMFNLNDVSDDDFQKAFELSDPGIEHISICQPPALGLERVFRGPVTLPVVLGASIIQIHDYDDEITPIKVIVESWIKNDQVVGKKAIVWIGSYDDTDKWSYEQDDEPREDVMVEQFKEHFEDRVVEETPKSVRIRMDNTENQILMRILEEDDDLIGKTRVVAIWEVIPADSTEDGFTKRSGYVSSEC